MRISSFVALWGVMLAIGHSLYGQPNVQGPSTVPPVTISDDIVTANTQWAGKRVGFLGDSMTDPNNSSTTCHYWKYLETLLGIKARVYARSGNNWRDIYNRAEQMYAKEGTDLDAILIWAGTNDYFHDAPIGHFYDVCDSSANVNGKVVPLKYRKPSMDATTFCGRINRVMAYLKHLYPRKQIVILTPIHRAYANFSKIQRDKATGEESMKWNVQPAEDFSNSLGLYIDDYVRVLREAGEHWSVPVIDLFSLSGLYPLEAADSIYFHDAHTDLLHPDATGHWRLARTLQTQLLTLPVGGL